MQCPRPDPIQRVLTNLTEHLHSPAFAGLARHPAHPHAFTRSRKRLLPKLVACLCGFRGGSVQSEVDSFFAHMDTDLSALRRLSERALAKARAKLHVPALWGLNAKLMQDMQDQGLIALWRGRRLVCADATLLAPAQRACPRTRRRRLGAPIKAPWDFICRATRACCTWPWALRVRVRVSDRCHGGHRADRARLGADFGALADSACPGAIPTSTTVQTQAPSLPGLQTCSLSSVDWGQHAQHQVAHHLGVSTHLHMAGTEFILEAGIRGPVRPVQ
jgi:hypothetical protein